MFKACPYCHGDLYGGADEEICCIQCGCEPRPDDWTTIRGVMRKQAPRASGAEAFVLGGGA